MKVLILLIFLLVFASGCTGSDLNSENITDLNGSEIKDDISAIYNQFAELKDEVRVLVEKGLEIGTEQYSQLEERLNQFENTDVPEGEIAQTRLILLDIQPQEPSTAAVPQGTKDTSSLLPECAGQAFTEAPVDLNDIDEITPLGNTAPPDHTLPTEHMYIHLNPGGTSEEIFTLNAPGDIYILSVTDDGSSELTEYSIKFALCKDVFGYFNHVKSLSGEMEALIADIECQQWTQNPGNICSKELFHRVDAGFNLGGVGHLQGNFDFGVYDLRIYNNFSNPARYGDPSSAGADGSRSFYITCPLEYYDTEVKNALYGKITRTQEPRCGLVMQDVPGTLQGNWFYGDSDILTWSDHLSFIVDNIDPTKEVVSVGGVITDAGKWVFTPRTSGQINRKVSEVEPDGIYCYDEGNEGKILVKLSSETELKIEYKEGSCSQYDEFTNPVIYER